jgi:ParB-like chromosome segregation protein Spo0J
MSVVERIEIAHLHLRYEHTRIRQAAAVLRMADSLSRYGQRMPVLVADDRSFGHVLIDGYLRVKALKRMGEDLVTARLWPQAESDALVYMMVNMQGRTWDVYEQAAIIKELHLAHQISLGRIAQLLGKDKSWVSRRLLLLQTLDDEMIALILDGTISSWSAQRILTPMARANAEHAKCLAAALKKEKISTRRLALFFEHYRKSNRKIRQNMVTDPHLFLKALDTKTAQADAKTLNQGPEGRWVKDIRTVKHILARLVKAVPAVFYTGQSRLDRRRLLTVFTDTVAVMQALTRAIEGSSDDKQRKTPDDFVLAQKRIQDTAYQPDFKSVAQYGSPRH